MGFTGRVPKRERLSLCCIAAGVGGILCSVPLLGALARGEVSLSLVLASCGLLLVAGASGAAHRVVLGTLREHRDLFEATFEQAAVGMAHLSPEEKFLRVNPAFGAMLGYRPEELEGRSYRDVTHPADLETNADAVSRMLRGELAHCALEKRYLHSDGRSVWASVTVAPVFDPEGRVVHLVGVAEEITQRKRADEELSHYREKLEVLVAERSAELRQFSRVVEQSPVSVVITDLSGCITYVNPKFCELTGYTSEEIIGKNPRLLRTDLTPPDAYRDLWEALHAGKTWRGEFCNRKKDGSFYWERAYISPVVDCEGSVTHYVAVKEDITEQKDIEQKLRELSLSDHLTGLSNRRGFLLHAEQQVKVANRIGKGFLLLYADLDGMKWINDNLGHAEGDRALVDTAEILRGCLRSSDVVARLGGDEFVAMSLEASDASAPLRHRVLESVAAHNRKGERPYILSISLGIARYDPAHPCSVEELLARGDALMYQVKRRKKERGAQRAAPPPPSAATASPPGNRGRNG